MTIQELISNDYASRGCTIANNVRTFLTAEINITMFIGDDAIFEQCEIIESNVFRNVKQNFVVHKLDNLVIGHMSTKTNDWVFLPYTNVIELNNIYGLVIKEDVLNKLFDATTKYNANT